MSAEILPRITGTEMEYSVMQGRSGMESTPADNHQTVTKVAAYMSSQGVPHIYQFFANGSRMYPDCGQHFEIATAEDTSFIGTLANEIAGERILRGALQVDTEEGKYLQINRRVVDRHGETWGYHESYCANSAIRTTPASLALLGLHLATRNIFVGSGALRRLPRASGSIFTTAQKNFRLDYDYCQGTTNAQKAVVNLRDEPHSRVQRWRRIHVTSGDPNMSPWATLVKLGSTSLVLRLMEHGAFVPAPHLAQGALKQLSNHTAGDMTINRSARVYKDTGTLYRIRPREVQEMLYTAAEKLSHKIELPTEEKMVLGLWGDACAAAESNPDSLRNRVEWMAKLRFLERYAEKHDLPMSATSVHASDEQWDVIGPHGGGLKLRETMWSDWMPDEALILERQHHAPETTRATDREKIIRRFHTYDQGKLGIEWSSFTTRGERQRHYILGDPYKVGSPAVKYLCPEETAA